MATSEFRFTTKPEPLKKGVRLNRAKYEVVRMAVLENLRTHGALTFTQLGNLVEEQLHDNSDNAVMWYFTIVKLDMEACGEIHRVPNSKPQLIALHENV